MSLKAYQSLTQLINKKEQNLSAIKEAIQIAKKELKILKARPIKITKQIRNQLNIFNIEREEINSSIAKLKGQQEDLKELIQTQKKNKFCLDKRIHLLRKQRAFLQTDVLQNKTFLIDLSSQLENQSFAIINQKTKSQRLKERIGLLKSISAKLKGRIKRRRLYLKQVQKRVKFNLTNVGVLISSWEKILLRIKQIRKESMVEQESLKNQSLNVNGLQNSLNKKEQRLDQKQKLLEKLKLVMNASQEGLEIRNYELAKRERIIQTKEKINKL